MADYMSRHPYFPATENRATKEAENYVHMVENNFGPRAIKLNEIISETNKDPVLGTLKHK